MRMQNITIGLLLLVSCSVDAHAAGRGSGSKGLQPRRTEVGRHGDTGNRRFLVGTGCPACTSSSGTYEIPPSPSSWGTYKTPPPPSSWGTYETPPPPSLQTSETPPAPPLWGTYETASAPSSWGTYVTALAPSYETTSAPSYETASAPSYETPSAPSYETASAPSYETPLSSTGQPAPSIQKYGVAIGCSVAGAILVVALVCWFVRSRLPRSTNTRKSYGDTLPKKLTSATIRQATNNFKHQLGEGAFSKVYLGNLEGKDIAVKQLTQQQLSVSTEKFVSEIEILMKVKHKNLVNFVAYCNNGGDRFLCFEYLSGGSLDKLLYASRREKKSVITWLDWRRRYYIITEICTGLRYLHVDLDSEEKIVHMDLKAGNILIRDKEDGGFVVKIADFGISRLFKGAQTHEYITNGVIGTRAYLPPESLSRSKVSEKVDIYCFGMLLLEMVTGWCATDDDFPTVATFITKGREALSSGDVVELLDGGLRVEDCSVPQVLNCIKIACDCLREEPGQRPDAIQIDESLRCDGSKAGAK